MKKTIILSLIILFLICPVLFAETITVRGVVKDTLGEPIVGAVVYVPGTFNWAVTGQDGSYHIDCPHNATLIYSCLGFEDEIESVNGRTVINVVLNDDPNWGLSVIPLPF